MGATVTTGKRANAFLSNEGVPIFILEEETYEKNVHPHTPRWNVVAFGEYHDVLKRIFCYASATDGGMLQGKSGWISSVGYIQGWRNAIANARLDINHGDPRTYDLYIGKSFYDPIEEGSQEKALKALADEGYQSIADRLLKGEKIGLHMKDDLNVLLALYGSKSNCLPSWSIFRNGYPQFGSNDPASMSFDLQIPQAMCKKPILPSVEFYDLRNKGDSYPNELRFVRIGDKLIKRHISTYQYLSNFIERDLIDLEMQYPGCAEHFIRCYKQYEKSAGILPSSIELQILYKTVEGEKRTWVQEGRKKLAQAFNDGKEGVYFITAQQVFKRDEENKAAGINGNLFYWLANLEQDDLTIDARQLLTQDELLLI